VTTQVVADSASSSGLVEDDMEQESVSVEPMGPGDAVPLSGAGPERASRLVLTSVVVGVIAVLAAVVVLRFWSAPLSVPYDYDGDAAFYLMEVQSLHEHGTYLTNPDLGYPYGQDTRDLPQGVDNLNWLVLRVLSIFGGPAMAMNLFYLLTYGVIAGMAFAVLRLLRIRTVIAGVIALLYAFLPYHLLRRAQHLLLSSYGFVPLAVLFALAVLSDAPPLTASAGAGGPVGRPASRFRPHFRVGRQGLLILAACAAMGSLGAYYAVFSILLFMAAGVAAALARRSWRSFWSGLVLSVAVGVVVVANLAPSIWYRLRHGANPEAIARHPYETEVYGLRVQQLFSPRYGHRNSFLARLATKAYTSPMPSELGQTLGVVGAIGVAVLLVVVVVGLVSRRDGPWWELPAGRALRHAGMLLVVILLTATISGFSWFLSAAGLRDIRAWNRAVVVVGFLGLLAVAVVVEAWARRADRRRGARWTRIALAVGAALVLLLGWYDQTSSIDRRAPIRAAWESDHTLFRQMASALPAGTPVFQLPLVSFPESPVVGRVQSYDPARGYLHAPSLRWSYGATRGRVPAWPADLDQRPGADLVAYLHQAGFGALLVDRFGYADDGHALEARLAGAATLRAQSPDGRFAWYQVG
jgi:phosphoglycerol transferase